MRVIEKRSVLMDRELIRVHASRHYWVLTDPRYTVHFYGYFESVPMNGRHFRQHVVEDDTHAVALIHLDHRSRYASVVAPRFHLLAWNKLRLDRLGHQVELFDAIDEIESQLWKIWSLVLSEEIRGRIREISGA